MITMMLGGLWHGAAWLFIIWGVWHGFLLVAFHHLKKHGLVPSNDRPVGYWINRQVTFLLIVIGWVFFRAADVRGGGTRAFLDPSRGEDAGPDGRPGRAAPTAARPGVPGSLWRLIAGCWLWCNFAPNSSRLSMRHARGPGRLRSPGMVMGICLLRFGVGVDFLYFRF